MRPTPRRFRPRSMRITEGRNRRARENRARRRRGSWHDAERPGQIRRRHIGRPPREGHAGALQRPCDQGNTALLAAIGNFEAIPRQHGESEKHKTPAAVFLAQAGLGVTRGAGYRAECPKNPDSPAGFLESWRAIGACVCISCLHHRARSSPNPVCKAPRFHAQAAGKGAAARLQTLCRHAAFRRFDDFLVSV
jgi:hypothetical protein